MNDCLFNIEVIHLKQGGSHLYTGIHEFSRYSYMYMHQYRLLGTEATRAHTEPSQHTFTQRHVYNLQAPKFWSNVLPPF